MVTTHPTDYEVHLFHEGSLYESYQAFGAHITTEGGIEGTRFSVWAPHAKSISVVGEFNDWSREDYVMEKLNPEGIWSLFIPSIGQGELYKYAIQTKDGRVLLKADPYAFFSLN
ncbi:hypothetical protein GCM10020331_029610 [Ectobacillus funiculus]